MGRCLEKDWKELLADCFPKIMVNILPHFAVHGQDALAAQQRENAHRVYDLLKDSSYLGKQVCGVTRTVASPGTTCCGVKHRPLASAIIFCRPDRAYSTFSPVSAAHGQPDPHSLGRYCGGAADDAVRRTWIRGRPGTLRGVKRGWRCSAWRSAYLCRWPDCHAPQGTGPRAQSALLQLRRDQGDPGLPQQMPQHQPGVPGGRPVQNSGETTELPSGPAFFRAERGPNLSPLA